MLPPRRRPPRCCRSFRDYIDQHQAEITALQILYSRPYKQRLTEPMLKELEKKLRDNHAAWTEDNLWNAFAAARPGKVKGRSQAGRFADLVALVRFALEQQPVLTPFADSVTERFESMADGQGQGRRGVHQPEQLAWLNLIRDHIATSLSIEARGFRLRPLQHKAAWARPTNCSATSCPSYWMNSTRCWQPKYNETKTQFTQSGTLIPRRSLARTQAVA